MSEGSNSGARRRNHRSGGRPGGRPRNQNNSSGPARRRSGSSRGRPNGRRGATRGRPSKRPGSHGQYIDPSRYVKAAKTVELEPYQPQHAFTDFDLDPALQRNLAAKGFKEPTQIQDQSIETALSGIDLVGIANTGTGKTAAFLLPTITKLVRNRGDKVLILAPTRELAMQIQQESRAFSKGMRLFDVLLIGGAPINRQIRELKRRPEIIIGTPGRIKDHLERRTLKLDQVTTVVLDEVDRMLDMGFIHDIRQILSQAPPQRQSLFYSATISPTINDLIHTFTHRPEKVMARTAETSDNVEQSVVRYTDNNDQFNKLQDILGGADKTIIFCATKYKADRLSKKLVERGFNAQAIHGGKSQNQRQRALKAFKDGKADILVATDVAARGIDVDGITHVVNFQQPQTYDDYTHRIGRTGRGGQMGHALTFVEA